MTKSTRLELLAEIERLHSDGKINADNRYRLMAELANAQNEIHILRDALETQVNATEMAITFLEFHGKKSPQLSNSIKLLENITKNGCDIAAGRGDGG